jgi:hypothetical protein
MVIVKYEKLPLKVKKVFEKYENEEQDDYKTLSLISEDLKVIGWYMDYYLNAEITELRPMTKQEKNALKGFC